MLYYPKGFTEYNEDNNDVVDFIQESLECCGASSIDDWNISPYYKKLRTLPASCCGREEPDACPMNEAFTDVRYN